MGASVLSVIDVKAANQICMGAVHSAVVTKRGELFVWGYGEQGNLGQGDREGSLKPVR